MPESFHGLLVLDKPAGMTSRDVVNRVQRWFPRGTKIGHTGTLDPLATGVLVVCLGVATRLAEYVQRMEKVYHARIRLGARSDTDDADGAITPVEVANPPDRAMVERALQGFIGEIEQVPPAYSAAKVTGRRAYDLARRGEDVDLAPRRIHIHRIDSLAYEFPSLIIEVCCGKGTYIRSLARDLGERLGCGGYIETLRRTRVGRFETSRAIDLEATPDEARHQLLPPRAAVTELPSVNVSAAEAAALRQGKPLRLSSELPASVPSTPGIEMAMFDDAGELVAVGQLDSARTLRPAKVFSY